MYIEIRDGMGKVLQLLKPHGEIAFTGIGASWLVKPFATPNSITCYFSGELEGVPKWSLVPVENGGNLIVIEPKDEGVFFQNTIKKGLPIVSLPQLYYDLMHAKGRGKEQTDDVRRLLFKNFLVV